MSTTEYLHIWKFTKPGETSVTITAVYAMREDEARASAERKGYNVDGWEAAHGTTGVGVEAAPAADGTLNRYRVTLSRTQIAEVEVDAKDEAEARKKAKEEAEDIADYDWDDDDMSVYGCHLIKEGLAA